MDRKDRIIKLAKLRGDLVSVANQEGGRKADDKPDYNVIHFPQRPPLRPAA